MCTLNIGVTESLFCRGQRAGGGGPDLHLGEGGGGQEEGIAMKGAQSKYNKQIKAPP